MVRGLWPWSVVHRLLSVVRHPLDVVRRPSSVVRHAASGVHGLSSFVVHRHHRSHHSSSIIVASWSVVVVVGGGCTCMSCVAAAPARSMSLSLLLLLATVVVAAADAGRTARRCACWDALAQAWEALFGAAFSVAFVRFGIRLDFGFGVQMSEVFRLNSVCKHWAIQTLSRPHLGGHASCMRAGLTPTSLCQGLEVGAHPLMHAEL